MAREYRTTCAEWNHSSSKRICGDWVDTEEHIPDPYPPDGDRWKLVGSAATRSTLFWFWERAHRKAHDHG